MAQDELVNRLRRIYSALNAIVVFDMTKLVAKRLQCGRFVGIMQDFSGGRGVEEMENLTHSVNHNIVSLKDHLKTWARSNCKDAKLVDATVRASPELQMVIDVWNRDKHGGDRNDGGLTGKNPRLGEVGSQMKLTTAAKEGASMVMRLGPGGVPQVEGDGTAQAVITADIIDSAGKVLGDLFEVQQGAIEAWEKLLELYGVHF